MHPSFVAMETHHVRIDERVRSVWNAAAWACRSVASAHGYIQSLVEAVEGHAAG